MIEENFLNSLPYAYERDSSAEQIRENYEAYKGKSVRIAGRIIRIREVGKIIFADLLDQSGSIQLYFEFGLLKERFQEVKKLNRGDIIGVSGKVFKTDPGEISIKVEDFSLLMKAMRVLPDKWKGLKDVELRYRNRHLDFIVNPQVRKIFLIRHEAIRLIREFMNSRGYIEFETPAIQPLYGGADAEPFKTFVNTLNEEDYLRISDELYLKRLIIGGFEKVYEIYKAFRNEDIDSTHSPEFTMLEAYEAYTDYNGMMKLNEEMFEYIAKGIFGTTKLAYQGSTIDMKGPFKRVEFVKSINEKVGEDILELEDEELFRLAEKNGIRFEKGKRFRAHAYDKLFSKLVQPELIEPTFAIDFPKEMSPLARPNRKDPRLVERFELYISGIELSNAYSELNNPIIQRKNFEEQEERAKMGDKEAEPLDLDFVEAMEYGMPPTGGIGIGIDRLIMILTNQTSIKEVIAFIMEKRR
ncbi:MAG: lysine--tRNA ligase [Candidatus Micrarchaeaceae archaeon]